MRVKALLLAGVLLLVVSVGAVFWPTLTGFEDAVTAEPQLPKLNVNTATVDQLANVPGIGWTLAERMVALRGQVGEYSSLLELLGVQGVRSSMIEKWEQYLTVSDENS